MDSIPDVDAGAGGGRMAGRARSSLPAALVPVLAVLVLEALALLTVAALGVRALVVGEARSGGLTAGVVVLALGVAALLVAAARALAAGRRWGRAPALTWQLLQLAVAVPALSSQPAALPAALLVASVVVVVGLFLPAVVRHTAVGGEPGTL